MAQGDWFDQGGTGAAVDVAELLDGTPMQAVRDIVDAGALVSIGKTSDGGAVGITITVDGRWRREYFRKQDEVLAWLAEAVPAVTEARGDDRPSAAQRQRPRRRQS